MERCQLGCGFVCFVVLNVGSAVLNVGSAVLNGEVSVGVWFCLFRCVEWDLLCVVLGVVAQPRNCGCVDVPCSAVCASRWACACDYLLCLFPTWHTQAVSFDPESNVLVSAGADHTFRVWSKAA
jgi:hypothetical protein